MPTDQPVKVRIVTDPGSRAAGLLAVVVVAGVVVLVARWKHYGPYLATRTARRLRRMAQVIEDRGLDIARPKENNP
jgi:hypothetical protein